VLQESQKGNSYTQNNMVFDHMNTNRSEERANGYKYPQEDFKSGFSDTNENQCNAYQRFLQFGYKQKIANSGTIVSYNDF